MMSPDFAPVTGLLASLDLLAISQADAVLHIQLNRPAKRNAISDGLVAQLHTAFVNLPQTVKAVVVSGAGAHFCAGLDLSELVERDMKAAILHSRSWHAAFDAIQFGTVPVVAVLQARSVPTGITRAAWTQALDVKRLGGRQGPLAGNKKGCRGILFYLNRSLSSSAICECGWHRRSGCVCPQS